MFTTISGLNVWKSCDDVNLFLIFYLDVKWTLTGLDLGSYDCLIRSPQRICGGVWCLMSSKLFTKGTCPGDVAVHEHKTVASSVSSPGAGKVLWPLSCPSSSILFCLSSRTTHLWLWPCQPCPPGVWPALVWTHRLWPQRTLMVLARFIFFPP